MKVSVTAERYAPRKGSADWVVVTTYPDGRSDEATVYDREQAEHLGRLIKAVARLTDDEDLISLIATQCVDPDTSHMIIRGLKIMKGA